MGIFSRIGYWLLLGLCWLVSILPTWFLYHCVQDVLYFFMYKVFGYRVGVVRGNLALAFPEKTDDERHTIERLYYRHLAEIMVDYIDFASITPRQMRKRLVIENLEEHERIVGGRDWIAQLAHYGSWEYFAAYPLYTGSDTASLYHPLKSKSFDRLMLRLRSRFGMDIVPMNDVVRYLAGRKGTAQNNLALGMIADQAPPRKSTYLWFDFFGRKTRFFTGSEKLATRYGMQIYVFHMEKTSRAHYRGRFEMIYDGVERVRPGDITERYVRWLERQIRERPELWMWSHKRWKHNPEYASPDKFYRPADASAPATENKD